MASGMRNSNLESDNFDVSDDMAGSREETQKAVLNILEDFSADKVLMENTQNAMLNLLEDASADKALNEQSQKAMLNILEDFSSDKLLLESTQKAVLNILEDSSSETERLLNTEKAVINVLEDYAEGNKELKELSHELSQQIDCVNQAALVSITDARGDIIFANPLFCKISKYDVAELIGENHRLLKSGKQPDSLFVGMWKAISSGHVWCGEIINKAKDGTYYWVDTTIIPFKDIEGKIEKYVSVRFDITERKNAEAELKQTHEKLEEKVDARTAELKQINEELESFSYSVSHDLRAPLRSIIGYSSILKEEYQGKLDDYGHYLVNTIVKNTSKMGLLIDDILAFSRLGRQETRIQPLAMKQLFQTTYHELMSNEKERCIKFVVKNVKGARGDKAMITLLVTNLLSNAIKYTRNNRKAVIEVGGKSTDNGYTYHVRDNGVGFNNEFRDKLFGVFQRLHKERDFEGTGVGLAIAQRIVHQHHGRIWGEGKTKKGATFYFTLG